MVKDLRSSRGPMFDSQLPRGSSEPSVILVLGTVISTSGICGHQVQTHMKAKHPNTLKLKIDLKRFAFFFGVRHDLTLHNMGGGGRRIKSSREA